MHRTYWLAAVAAGALAASPAAAQDHDHHHTPTSATTPEPHHHAPSADAPVATSIAGSGTARLPAAEGAMRGLHLASGDWMAMAHGTLLGAWTDQGGARGDRMAFLGSMAMLSAAGPIGDGTRLELRTMLSLEPAMGAPGYPNLLATGETAGGRPLVDRQHPHDLFMELAARIDVDVAPGTSLFLYGGPVGEPALGPAAFMHRRSARYLPLAPIGHHWFDSTHITYGVVTGGLASRRFQLEASAFRGREPDEARWNIETPRLDSWSLRATWTPTPHWAVQLSHGRLEQPETTHGGQDERRTTASIHHARGGFAATLGVSIKDRVPGTTLIAWLGEANWDLARSHSLFGRIEHLENDELFSDHGDPLHDRRFRVTRAEAGYAYRIAIGGEGELALGAAASIHLLPDALAAAYGPTPIGVTAFARLALGN